MTPLSARRLLVLLMISICICMPCPQARAGNEDQIAKIQQDLDNSLPITQQMVQEIERILASEPQNRSAHLALATCYDRLALPDQANDEYATAAQLSADDPHAIVEYIKSLVRGGRSQQGMKLLEATAKRFPNDPEVMFWYANYLASINHTKEAMSMYKGAMVKLASMKSPAILGLPSALAELYLENSRFGDAITYADKDIGINKQFWLAYKIKGFALYAQGRYGQAIEYLRQAYLHSPYKPDVAKKYATACIWNSDYKQALEPSLVNLALTASLDSNNFMEKHQLREIVRKLPERYVRERIAQGSKNIDLRLRNAAFHFALGDVLDTAGMSELAIDQYQNGLAMQPDFARGMFRLGKDLELYRHEYERALFCYTRARKLDPKDPEIAAYTYRLESRLPARRGDLAWRLKDWLVTSIRPQQ